MIKLLKWYPTVSTLSGPFSFIFNPIQTGLLKSISKAGEGGGELSLPHKNSPYLPNLSLYTSRKLFPSDLDSKIRSLDNF